MFSGYQRKKFEKKLEKLSKEEIIDHIELGLWYKWKVEIANEKLAVDDKKPNFKSWRDKFEARLKEIPTGRLFQRIDGGQWKGWKFELAKKELKLREEKPKTP